MNRKTEEEIINRSSIPIIFYIYFLQDRKMFNRTISFFIKI